MHPSLTRRNTIAYILCVLAVAAFIIGQGVQIAGDDATRYSPSVVLAFLAAICYINPGDYRPNVAIAGAGLAVFGLGMALAWVDSAHFSLWHALAIHLGLTPAANALAFWLMSRYSNIRPQWGALGVKVTTLWLVSAGLVLCADTRAWPPIPGALAAFYVLLAYIVVAAHGHRAIIGHKTGHTLAAYWQGLTLWPWICGVGGVGAALTLPAVARAAHASILMTLPTFCALLAALALGMGLINQIIAELRAQNGQPLRRVTGLLSYWCVAGGWFVMGLALAALGVVQVFYGRIGYAATPDDLRPLLQFYRGGAGIAFVGTLIFGLGVYARRLR